MGLVMFPYVLLVFFFLYLVVILAKNKQTQLALTYNGAYILRILCNWLDIFNGKVPPKSVTYL